MQHLEPMTKNTSKFSLWNVLDEDTYAEWLTNYGKILLIAIACFGAVLLIGLRLSYGSSGKQISDYLKAKKEFATFQTAEGEAQKEAFAGLQQIMQRLPDLHAKYDGLIAQQLLLQNDVKQGEEYAGMTLLRTDRDHLSIFSEFSRIALLISQGDYKTALDKTTQLKKKMIEQPAPRSFGDILFAYNLLNQAFLYQQLGNTVAEKEKWRELKRYAGLVNEAPPTDLFSRQAFLEMFAQFEAGKVTLKEYIEMREKA